MTNVEEDHLDYWGDAAQLCQGFRRFIEGGRPGGRAIVGYDDKGVRGILNEIEIPVATFSVETAAADFAARHIALRPFGSTFEFLHRGHPLGLVELNVPGLHNVSNAAAALGLALEIGADFRAAADALAEFRGVKRRFQILGEVDGITVVDDYGHHPTEVARTLAAACGAIRPRRGRVFAIFQPHRYTRTRQLHEEFGAAFGGADVAIITDVYSAGEKPIEGVSGELICDSAARAGHPDVRYVARREDVPDAILDNLRPGDLVLTIGAGDIYKTGHQILEALRARCEAAEATEAAGVAEFHKGQAGRIPA